MSDEYSRRPALRILLGFLLLFSMNAFAQQKGQVRGQVLTSDNRPAPFVSVLVKGTAIGGLTMESGNYQLKNVPTGPQILLISVVGYEAVEVAIDVKTGVNQADIVRLKEDEKTLNEVTIRGKGRYDKQESDYVARIPIKNLENPQIYSTVSSELLKEQVVTNFDDALKNVPGVDKLWTSTGRGGDGAAYFTMRGFSIQPSMINGVAGLSNGGLDPANIERVEVIKGPSGTLFGSSLVNFGGLINLVTKKPHEVSKGEFSYTTGSYGLNRLTADVNTPLSDKVFFRVNGALHTENSFQDAGFKRTGFIAPSLLFKASDRLTVHLNAEVFTSKATNPLMVFLNRSRTLIAKTPKELGINWNRSFTSDDITVSTPTTNLYGQVSYKLSDKWTSQTNVSSSVRKSVGLYSYVMFLDAVKPANDTLLSRYVGDQNATTTTTSLQQNFIGDFRIGSVRNRVVAGLDYLGTKARTYSSYVLFDNVNSVRLNDVRYSQLTRPAVEAKLAQVTAPTKNTAESHTYSAYVSDVINVTDQLLAMLSVRFDRFDNKGTYNIRTGATTGAYTQNAVSPKFGLVYQVMKDRLSVFANYMNGFKNVGNGTQPDGSVAVFKPQQANQFEAGVKGEFFDGKLTGSVSYYDIYVSDITRPDPERVGFTIQDGNMSSKGIEFELAAHPVPGLNLIAGYAHNDSKNEKTDAGSIGRRTVGSGPADLANLWISYAPVAGSLKGLGFGIGGNYAGENIITNSAATGQFIVPAYTVLNATAFYDTPSLRFALKADNFTNQLYWKGWTTVEPQKPRSIAASVIFRY